MTVLVEERLSVYEHTLPITLSILTILLNGDVTMDLDLVRKRCLPGDQSLLRGDGNDLEALYPEGL
jgi:hypothetical protein